MELMEVAYQPEVANSLLKVQQAMAKLDARELIVEGATKIVHGALDGFAQRGI